MCFDDDFSALVSWPVRRFGAAVSDILDRSRIDGSPSLSTDIPSLLLASSPGAGSAYDAALSYLGLGFDTVPALLNVLVIAFTISQPSVCSSKSFKCSWVESSEAISGIAAANSMAFWSSIASWLLFYIAHLILMRSSAKDWSIGTLLTETDPLGPFISKPGICRISASPAASGAELREAGLNFIPFCFRNYCISFISSKHLCNCPSSSWFLIISSFFAASSSLSADSSLWCLASFFFFFSLSVWVFTLCIISMSISFKYAFWVNFPMSNLFIARMLCKKKPTCRWSSSSFYPCIIS